MPESLNREPNDVRMRREVSQLLEQVKILQGQIASLQSDASAGSSTTDTALPGDNILRNCLAQFSDDAYNNLGLGGDAAQRIAFWYRHADSDTALAMTSAELLKAPGHSGYAADDPDWDNGAGQIRLGTTDTISQQLINRYVQRDVILYFQFDATLRTNTALTGGLTFYAGFWDKTAGQEKWVSGATLALTATVEGTPGATTRDYRVIVTADTGETYQIDRAPIANAPNAPSTVDFVRLSWAAIPGRISARVEKLQGGVFALLTTITSGSTEYNDYGDAGTVIGAFSTGTLTALRARVEDNSFLPEFGVVKRFGYAIRVPSDYDLSLTTTPQVLRFGLSAALTDAHQLLLTRFQLGFSSGAFQLSAADLAITNATSVVDPPSPGEDPPCFNDVGTIKTVDGLKTFAELRSRGTSLVSIENRTGTHAAHLLVHDFAGEMIDIGDGQLVTLDHLFQAETDWRRAAEMFPDNPRMEFKGQVYNLEVLSDDPADHHYVIIVDGEERVVHNRKIDV